MEMNMWNSVFSYLAKNISQQLVMFFSLILHFRLGVLAQVSVHNCKNNTVSGRDGLESTFCARLTDSPILKAERKVSPEALFVAQKRWK